MSKSETFDLSMLTAALAPGEPAVFLSCQPDNIKEGYSDGLRLAERGGLRSIQIEREPLLQSPESLGAVLRNHELPTKGVVLLISPLGRMPKTPGRFDTSELASRNLVRCIPPELDVALALPGHALSGKTRSMLAEIAEGRHVRAVIQLPGELLMPGIYSKLQLFVAYLTHDVADRAAFVKMGPGGAVDVARQLAELWGGRPTVDGGFGLDPSEFDIANGILPDQLDPRRLQRVNEAIAIGEMHRVSDFCEVFPGQGRKVTQHETPSPDALPLLVGSHIHSGMILRDDNPDRAEPANRASLEPGDLVLRAIANAQKLVVAAQVEEVDLPLAASQSVIVVRPLPNLSGNQRRVLRYFVESDRFASQLTSLSLGSARRVTASEVADAKFPMADSDFSNALLAVESASADFAKWRDESLSQLRLSVDAKDLVASRAQLIRNSNHHRQRAAAGRLLDDLGHRVTTRYPLPVAYRWRRAVAALGGPEEINAVLHAQEVLLAYLAMMSLTFSRELGLGEGARKEISKQLSKDKRGLGLGQWGQIVSQTSKNREFKVLPPGHPLIDVRDFLRKPGVEHAASRLKLLRNSLAHLTEFGPGEAELARQDAWSDLETLLSAAEFVTEYPLIHVTDTAWNDIDSTNSLGFRRLTGDSPIVRKEYIQSQSRTIERGSLYLKGANDDLHWLRPTMIGASCPACGHWSTFLIDRYRKGEDVVEYKSLEHGHSLDGPESSARDLAHLGLLPRPTPDHDSADLPANAQRFQLAVEGLRAHGQES